MTGSTGNTGRWARREHQTGTLGGKKEGTPRKAVDHPMSDIPKFSVVWYAGFGFVCIAGETAGITPLLAVDNDPNCIDAMKANLPANCTVMKYDLLPQNIKECTERQMLQHAERLAEMMAECVNTALRHLGFKPVDPLVPALDGQCRLSEEYEVVLQNSIPCDRVSLAQGDDTRDSDLTKKMTTQTILTEAAFRRRVPITCSFYEQVCADDDFNNFFKGCADMLPELPLAHVSYYATDFGTPQLRSRQFFMSGNRRLNLSPQQVIDSLASSIKHTVMTSVATVLNIDPKVYEYESASRAKTRKPLDEYKGYTVMTSVPNIVKVGRDREEFCVRLPTAYRFALQGVDPHLYFIPENMTENVVRKGLANGVPIVLGEALWINLVYGNVELGPSAGFVWKPLPRQPGVMMRSHDSIEQFVEQSEGPTRWRFMLGNEVEIGEDDGQPVNASYVQRLKDALPRLNPTDRFCECLCGERADNEKRQLRGGEVMFCCRKHRTSGRGDLGKRKGVGGKTEDRRCHRCGNDDDFLEDVPRLSKEHNDQRNDERENPSVLSCVDKECPRVCCMSCLKRMYVNAVHLIAEENKWRCDMCEQKRKGERERGGDDH